MVVPAGRVLPSRGSPCLLACLLAYLPGLAWLLHEGVFTYLPTSTIEGRQRLFGSSSVSSTKQARPVFFSSQAREHSACGLRGWGELVCSGVLKALVFAFVFERDVTDRGSCASGMAPRVVHLSLRDVLLLCRVFVFPRRNTKTCVG